MRLRIEIDLDNDAFKPRPGPEAAKVLVAVSGGVNLGLTENLLRDTNGNLVGRWWIDGADEED